MVISTSVSVATRSINVLLGDGTTERFALVQASNGDLHWRHDIFALADDGDRQWLRHVGRIAVGEVIARIPSCERHVVAWTREEVEAGPDEPGLDLFQRDARRRALLQLSAELTAVRAAA